MNSSSNAADGSIATVHVNPKTQSALDQVELSRSDDQRGSGLASHFARRAPLREHPITRREHPILSSFQLQQAEPQDNVTDKRGAEYTSEFLRVAHLQLEALQALQEAVGYQSSELRTGYHKMEVALRERLLEAVQDGSAGSVKWTEGGKDTRLEAYASMGVVAALVASMAVESIENALDECEEADSHWPCIAFDLQAFSICLALLGVVVVSLQYYQASRLRSYNTVKTAESYMELTANTRHLAVFAIVASIPFYLLSFVARWSFSSSWASASGQHTYIISFVFFCFTLAAVIVIYGHNGAYATASSFGKYEALQEPDSLIRRYSTGDLAF